MHVLMFIKLHVNLVLDKKNLVPSQFDELLCGCVQIVCVCVCVCERERERENCMDYFYFQ